MRVGSISFSLAMAMMIASSVSAEAQSPAHDVGAGSADADARYDAMPDTQGAGSYRAGKEIDPGFPDHVICRPRNLRRPAPKSWAWLCRVCQEAGWTVRRKRLNEDDYKSWFEGHACCYQGDVTASIPSAPVARARRQASTGQPTLTSVAKHAGVSSATVSRYLNMPDVVARDTAERIREAIEHLGYVPNLLAGGLASNRSRLVAVIVPSVSFSIFNDTIDGIVEALARAGYTAMLGLSGEGDERLDSVIDAAIARRPDGIIITAASTDHIRRKLEKSGITIIETWDLPESPLDIAVGFSHRAVGRALGAFAMAQGYRTPLVISASGRRARLRYEGLAEVLAEHDMPPPPVDYLGGTTRFGEGRRRFAHALDRDETPDLVICSSDWLAQGVLIEANCRGLTVPQDLGVIGFGDLAFAAEMDPPITSVHIPGDQIGERAVEAMIRRNQGQAVEQLVDVGFEIVSRATTRRRPS